jgi:hypothetical protein
MNTLDEIEAKSLNEWIFGDDVTLLIRAVRQLGTVIIAVQDSYLAEMVDAIDPDVLALLEEE